MTVERPKCRGKKNYVCQRAVYAEQIWSSIRLYSTSISMPRGAPAGMCGGLTLSMNTGAASTLREGKSGDGHVWWIADDEVERLRIRLQKIGRSYLDIPEAAKALARVGGTSLVQFHTDDCRRTDPASAAPAQHALDELAGAAARIQNTVAWCRASLCKEPRYHRVYQRNGRENE